MCVLKEEENARGAACWMGLEFRLAQGHRGTALSLILLQVGLLAAPLGDLCVITKLFSRSFGLFFLFRDVQASDLSLQWDLRLWVCLYE